MILQVQRKDLLLVRLPGIPEVLLSFLKTVTIHTAVLKALGNRSLGRKLNLQRYSVTGSIQARVGPSLVAML